MVLVMSIEVPFDIYFSQSILVILLSHDWNQFLFAHVCSILQPVKSIEDATETIPVETIYICDYDFLVWTELGSVYSYIITLSLTFFQPPPAPPEFPAFPIKACILGKSFSGKTAAAQRLAEGK